MGDPIANRVVTGARIQFGESAQGKVTFEDLYSAVMPLLRSRGVDMADCRFEVYEQDREEAMELT